MSTEKIERYGNRTQTESGKLNGVFCHCRVIRTLSLDQGFTQIIIIIIIINIELSSKTQNKCRELNIRKFE